MKYWWNIENQRWKVKTTIILRRYNIRWLKIAKRPKKPQWPQKGSQSVQNPQIWIAVIQGSRLMPILWLFVRFLKKAGGFAGPPALQWVYSILAFCRGQGKRRAPAVQTLRQRQARALRYYRIGIKSSILLFKSIVSVLYRYRNSRF